MLYISSFWAFGPQEHVQFRTLLDAENESEHTITLVSLKIYLKKILLLKEPALVLLPDPEMTRFILTHEVFLLIFN